MRPEDLARLAALEELHTEKAVSLAANWPGDEPDAFHHAGIVLALREARTAVARIAELPEDIRMFVGKMREEAAWFRSRKWGDTGLRQHGEAAARLMGFAATTIETRVGQCDWTEDEDGVWHTACGTAWCSESGGDPADHRMLFCYQCGSRLVATKSDGREHV